MEDNCIGDEGAEIVGVLLKNNSSLTELNMKSKEGLDERIF